MPVYLCHVSSVKRIKFRTERNVQNVDNIAKFELATCGDDHSVRVYTLTFN